MSDAGTNESPSLDFLAVGAGACGLVAAIAAHDAGLSSAVVEKLGRPGGNSALSTGSVIGAGSRFQRAASIEDGPARMVADLSAIAGATDNPALVRRLAEISAGLVEWLVDTVGCRLQLVTAYRHIGHTVPRLHAPASRRGQDLVDDLVAAANQRGIPIALGNDVAGLLLRNGAVQGVRLASGEAITARKVLLALNGFAANRALVREYCPEIADAQYFGAPGSTGEAVLWGREVGAALDNMAAYQGYAAVAYPHGSLLSWTTIEKGGILLGRDARRFGNEGLGYSGYARVVLEHGGEAVALFDQRIFQIAAGEEEFLELWRYGGVRQADSAAAAAAAMNLDPVALTEELDRTAAAARGEAPDRFGRRDFGLAPLVPPFYVARVIPGLFHTQGGLRVDGDARVQRPDGTPVPNLFAGGGAAAGISGRAGALGYASGNGLLSATGLGWLAAQAAARELRT